MDMIGRHSSTVSGASSHTDLPDIDQDDAILVSYSQSNAEKFLHLRPQFQRRASSEEPQNDSDQEDSPEHVHVIHISDEKVAVRQQSPAAKSVVSIKAEDLSQDDLQQEHDEILNVIETSFKNRGQHDGPSPLLDAEDLDILNSIVPEPSIVVLDSRCRAEPQITSQESQDEKSDTEVDEQDTSDAESEQIAPPSPYANNESKEEILQDNKEQQISVEVIMAENPDQGSKQRMIKLHTQTHE